MQWLDSVAGPGYAAALLWTFAALILLVIVLVIIRLVRNLTFGTFVAGGRNRKTRLAVMDATAVDSHRRLVLVRRDDIEHLLLIGGPTDVVVERDIRLAAPRRPALTGDGGLQPVPATAPRRQNRGRLSRLPHRHDRHRSRPRRRRLPARARQRHHQRLRPHRNRWRKPISRPTSRRCLLTAPPTPMPSGTRHCRRQGRRASTTR
ncbi:flagellar biosynthetic protein FliO [Mesorhizobium huakuii]|uniref:flagellar biosynthetic protein FliO n=1 Tax=Mesorhizobium huakuii TaxID=28104 RepID=UPI001FD4462C|nr:flagellar biosynthetic protein FliO [Mesorhizobium huakuii]